MQRKKGKAPDYIIQLLGVVFLPVNIAVLAALWVYRQLVGLWLQLTLGEAYGGLLSAGDKVYVPNVPASRKITLILWYLRSDQKIDVMQKMTQTLNEKIKGDAKQEGKLTSTFHTFLGQDYLLKNQIGIDEIIKPMPGPKDGTFNDAYLKKLVGDLSNVPLPRNHTALWEILVGIDPMDNANTNVEGYLYPVLFRIHHSTADGIRLVLFMSKIFSSDVNYVDKISRQRSGRKRILDQLCDVLSKSIQLVYLVVKGPAAILNMTFWKEEDENPIHNASLSGDKLIAWSAEQSIQRVNTVKNIKNRIPNTRFSEVVLSCVSASFYNYFQLKKWKVPPQMSVLTPLLFLYPESNSSKLPELRNDFTFADLSLPLVDPDHFINGLEDVKVSVEKMRKSPTTAVMYFLVNYICAVIPSQLLLKITTTKAFTATISIVPGAGRIKVFGDCDLETIISTAPHSNETGICFTILTYDDKFQICAFVDKAIMSEQEDVQYLVDEVFRNMDLLNKQSLQTFA
ncbi:uncharacterized protein LOC109539285 [Dendroctonus ponderosae]